MRYTYLWIDHLSTEGRVREGDGMGWEGNDKKCMFNLLDNGD